MLPPPLGGGCKVGPPNNTCETCCPPPGWARLDPAPAPPRSPRCCALRLQLNPDCLALSEQLQQSHPGPPYFSWSTLCMSTCRYFHFLTGLLSLQRHLPSITTPLLDDPFICVRTFQTLGHNCQPSPPSCQQGHHGGHSTVTLQRSEKQWSGITISSGLPCAK